MAVRSDQLTKLGFRVAALLAGVMAFAPAGRAEVKVSEPQSGVLVVEVRNATVEDVLAELSKSQNMQYEAAGPLAGSISGTYRGQLSRVVLRLLDGYNVVIRTSAAGLRVKVLNREGQPRVAAPAVGFGVPTRPAVSSNVDADEEKAQAAEPRGPSPVAAPPLPVRSAAPVAPGRHALASGPASMPSHPKVSSNVDQDEERSVTGN